MDDLLDHLIEESVSLVGKPVALMTKEDKVKAIQFNNDSASSSPNPVTRWQIISAFQIYFIYYTDVNKRKGEEK